MAASSVCRASVSAARWALLRGPHAPPALGSLARSGSTAPYAHVLYNLPETQVTTLDNGLRVASEHYDQPTCTVGVWIGVGSRYETGDKNGVGNFVEHMAFKGTKKHPGPEFEKEVESIGAHLNSYTSREQTAYYMKALSKDLPKAIEILGDVIQNWNLEDSQIEKQRNVILQEMEDNDTCLSNVVSDYLHATAYQGTPLAQTPEGTTTNIKNLTRADLTEFIENHYKAPRMVLAAAGGVDHKQLVDLAKQHFGSVPYEYKEISPPLLSPCRFTGSEIEDRDDAFPLAHVAVAVEGPGWENPDIFPLLVASALVGNYDHTCSNKHQSNTMAVIGAQKKLFQLFQSFNTCYTDTSLFGFYFVTDGMHIDDTMYFAQAQWMKLCTSVVESDVTRAKNTVRNAFAAQLDGTTNICETIGRHILTYGRRIPLAEWDARISEVDAKQVQEVCNKYVYDKCPAVVGVGPIEQLPDYNRIRSAMYWLRL
nr:cytochrome b-c1 complex subunit 1, mitochondrial [Pogona vitticeps]